MSVVAAAALTHRILIAGDTRLTVYRRGLKGPAEHHDNTLKIFPCEPSSVIGFVGNDVVAGADMLRRLLHQASLRWMRGGRPRRHDEWRRATLRFVHWVPRFLRAAYARTGSRENLDFLLAYTIPDVPPVITRAQISDLITRAGKRNTRNWLPGWTFDLMIAMQKDGATRVRLVDQWAPRIAVMSAPQFIPTVVGPLSLAVIGSGATPTFAAADDHFDMIMAGEGMELIAFDSAIGFACARAGISTVGGLRPTYGIGKGIVPIPLRSSTSSRTDCDAAETVELIFVSPSLWVQRHQPSGRELLVRPPWEVIAGPLRVGGDPFDHNHFPWGTDPRRRTRKPE